MISGGKTRRSGLYVAIVLGAIVSVWLLTACMVRSADAYDAADRTLNGAAGRAEAASATLSSTYSIVRGTVSGQVSDEAGVLVAQIPLPGFEIRLKDKRSGDIISTTVTDEGGRFYIDGETVNTAQHEVCWEGDTGWRDDCTDVTTPSVEGQAPYTQIYLHAAPGSTILWGRVVLTDSVSPWFESDRFGILQTAHVAVSSTAKLTMTVPTNRWGEFVALGVAADAPAIRAVINTQRLDSVGTPVSAQVAEIVELVNAPSASNPITVDLRIPVPDLRVDIASGRKKIPGKGYLISKQWLSETVRINASDVSPGREAEATYVYRWCTQSEIEDSSASAVPTVCLSDTENQAYTWDLPGDSGLHRLYASATVSGIAHAEDSLLVEVLTGTLDAGLIQFSYAHNARSEFLRRPSYGKEERARQYYQWADPLNRRRTLGDWWAINGFDPDLGTGGLRAAYLNWNELGFGRNMNCTVQDINVACFVSNYGDANQDLADAELAAHNSPEMAAATVAMEYSPIEGESKPVVKFYVYRGYDANSLRQLEANLDGDRDPEKYVPDLCLGCHGGIENTENFDKIRANFIPFDFDLLRTSSACDGLGTTDCTQEAAFRRLNEIVLTTQPTTQVASLIQGWYPSASAPPDYGWVPPKWDSNGTNRDTYRDVVRHACRTCHITRNDDLFFKAVSPTTTSEVASAFVYSDNRKSRMPHAMIPYSNFWLENNGQQAIDYADFVIGPNHSIEPSAYE